MADLPFIPPVHQRHATPPNIPHQGEDAGLFGGIEGAREVFTGMFLLTFFFYTKKILRTTIT